MVTITLPDLDTGEAGVGVLAGRFSVRVRETSDSRVSPRGIGRRKYPVALWAGQRGEA